MFCQHCKNECEDPVVYNKAMICTKCGCVIDVKDRGKAVLEKRKALTLGLLLLTVLMLMLLVKSIVKVNDFYPPDMALYVLKNVFLTGNMIYMPIDVVIAFALLSAYKNDKKAALRKIIGICFAVKVFLALITTANTVITSNQTGESYSFIALVVTPLFFMLMTAFVLTGNDYLGIAVIIYASILLLVDFGVFVEHAAGDIGAYAGLFLYFVMFMIIMLARSWVLLILAAFIAVCYFILAGMGFTNVYGLLSLIMFLSTLVIYMHLAGAEQEDVQPK